MTRAAPAPGTGVVVWLTGLPSAGKSTLAERVRARLGAAGVACAVLDGDAVRAALRPRPGYDPAGRDAFYETLAGLATLLASQGLVVLVAATAHRRAWRERARAAWPRFLEVEVRASPEECARRDPKGLWAAGTPDLPGRGVAYEAPEAPDVVAAGGHDEAAAAAVCGRVMAMTA